MEYQQMYEETLQELNRLRGEYRILVKKLEEYENKGQLNSYVVQASLMVDEIDMDNADWLDLKKITSPYKVEAKNCQEALKSFHNDIPISSLEEFEIICTKQSK